MLLPALLLPLLAAVVLAQGQGFVFENFRTTPDVGSNARDSPHSCGPYVGITCDFGPSSLLVRAADIAHYFITFFDSNGCQDISPLNSQLLRLNFTGSPAFTVSLTQTNPHLPSGECNPLFVPNPYTWDSVNAVDYIATPSGSPLTIVYIPIAHFNTDKSRAHALKFHAFRDAATATTLTGIDIVENPLAGIPGFEIPEKRSTGPLLLACTRSGSVAFGINSVAFGTDGVVQRNAETVMKAFVDADVKPTWFVSAEHLDNAQAVEFYRGALRRGHQVALQANGDPLQLEREEPAEIDRRITATVSALRSQLQTSSLYFRMPEGGDGARIRQSLERVIPGSYAIGWSIDSEDTTWGAPGGNPDDADKTTDAVVRDLNGGGSIVLAHLNYLSTAQKVADWIRVAQQNRKDVMRVDQCIQDPNAPPYCKSGETCAGVGVSVGGRGVGVHLGVGGN